MKKWSSALILICASAYAAGAQESGYRFSIGMSATYAPDSSHIFIGEAEKRRVWTGGLTFNRVLSSNKFIGLEYAAFLSPLFVERDPTIVGTTATIGGATLLLPVTPQRVVYENQNPIGMAGGSGGASVPVYPVYGSTSTFGFAFSPLGVRLRTRRSERIQPTFGSDVGLVYSSRDLPVDDSAHFNYLFSFGPGIEIFVRRNKSVRLDYVYRHMSNANSGNNNPGVDAGVIRLTVSRWGY